VMPLIGKWFVFWGVGVRIFLAGLRQSIQPRYTAEKILGIKNDEQLIVVQELGFSNLSLGVLGILTILDRSWLLPAAIVGALFYGLAGVRHIFSKQRNSLENGAMISNIFLFIVLLCYLIQAGFM
jgi:hypothetical protein